jgi:2-oxoisovalerate dehydrogenase E2 component (dihydrolipoyl transacylase)
VYPVKLPDVGEGVAEAELVSWLVAVGDAVTPESPLAEVLTDKATVEISSPVTGVVVALHGEPGDVLAVGSEIVGIELAGAAGDPFAAPLSAPVNVEPPAEPEPATEPQTTPPEPEPEPEQRRPAVAASGALAAPAVRGRARELGIDLTTITGSGPDGRVVHADLDRALVGAARHSSPARPDADDTVRVEPVRGVRRRIADRLTAAWADIPHITYVEAIDATELETLRGQLNLGGAAPRLTILPFLVRAIVIACAEQPRLNAHYDHAAGLLSVHDAVHVGIATQTDAGLMVPVVRDAGGRSLRDLAREMGRVTTDAREGSATREQLSGSTITVTSLGALGGIATTPILNAPEVAIVGVNKLETRPVWIDGSFQPRRVFNLSSSFDHRIVDGWDAATFVQRIRTLLESPALLFLDDE